MNTYLVKLGELTLKGNNRDIFEQRLQQNLRLMIKNQGAQIQLNRGRLFVYCPKTSAGVIEDALGRLVGIHSWAKSRVCDKNAEDVFAACIEEAVLLVEAGLKTFKIEARRADKSFPLRSYDLCCEAGAAILKAFPSLKVDVHVPDRIIEIEISKQAYVYGEENEGQRGLPVGTNGRGLLLLSGGIDSPVAGYMMAKRGLRIDAIYFHAYPYTSQEAKDKVLQLTSTISRYTMGIRLWTIPFTKIQLKIKEQAPEKWITIMTRMAMIDIANYVARRHKLGCLITGESIGQVASQTLENMTCIESRSFLPILRPLVAIDKHDIIQIAKKIGTYEISILPYPDCCFLFSPKHPMLKASLAEANSLYTSLDLDSLLQEAHQAAEKEHCGITFT